MKQYDRSQRVGEEVHRIVAAALQADVKDFDLERVTVTRCEMTRDLSEATIHYSVLGDETQKEECALALRKVSGFLQRLVGDRMSLRQTPRLHFSYDNSIVESVKMEKLFDQIARERDADEEVGRE